MNIKNQPDANVICLPKEKTGSNTYDKKSCIVSGWGATGIHCNIFEALGGSNIVGFFAIFSFGN